MVEMSRAVDGVYIRVQPWANQQGGAGKIKPGMNFVSRAERERGGALRLVLGSGLRARVSHPAKRRRAAGTVKTTKSVNSGDPD
jgi:hypothetical protein